MNKNLIVLTASALMLTGALAGCSQSLSPNSPAPHAQTTSPKLATPAPLPSPETPKAPATPSIFMFGTTHTWVDGVAVNVGKPQPFTPSQYAAGTTPGEQAVKFTITLWNSSKTNLQPNIYQTVSSGGHEASEIFDDSVGNQPTTVILPGGVVTYDVAYSVADPANIVLQIEPSMSGYVQAIYSTSATDPGNS